MKIEESPEFKLAIEMLQAFEVESDALAGETFETYKLRIERELQSKQKPNAES